MVKKLHILLFALLAGLPAGRAELSLCNMAALLGGDAHHHEASVDPSAVCHHHDDHAGHDHDEQGHDGKEGDDQQGCDRVPCSDDCIVDLPIAVSSSIGVKTLVSPCFVVRTSLEDAHYTLAGSKGGLPGQRFLLERHPPPGCHNELIASPEFSGLFLI